MYESTFTTMSVLKYAKILRDDKINEVIFLPSFQWVVLHTPWCVHNPLCESLALEAVYISSKSTSYRPPCIPDLSMLSHGTLAVEECRPPLGILKQFEETVNGNANINKYILSDFMCVKFF